MPHVSVFIPCLVDQLYPQIGVALVKLLRHLEFEVSYNEKVTCCGQPAFNAGQLHEARSVARVALEQLGQDKSECLICPSGSCTAMVRNFYPELFENLPESRAAINLGSKLFELGEFLEKQSLIPRLNGSFPKKVGLHNSCHSARELGLRSYSKIFAGIKDLQTIDPSTEPVCCGFGGLFCQKFENIAQSMAKTRLEMFQDAGVDLIVSNDPGCIMHLKVQAQQLKVDLPIWHTAELLVQAMNIQ